MSAKRALEAMPPGENLMSAYDDKQADVEVGPKPSAWIISVAVAALMAALVALAWNFNLQVSQVQPPEADNPPLFVRSIYQCLQDPFPVILAESIGSLCCSCSNVTFWQ